MRMQVMVDDLLTQYDISGKGKTIVLLHGWGDRAAGLRALRKELSKQFTVIAPDLPGFGGSAMANAVWGMTSYAEFIAHFLEKIEAEPVHAYIGHSNGGAIAIRGLGRGILQADKLVLLASAGIRDTYSARHKALRMVVKVGKVMTSPLPANIRRKLKRKVYDTVGSDMLVAEHLQETFKKVVTDDVRADAAKIAVPTLLLYGEQDRATPVGYGELFHQLISGSTLEVLPGTGHFVHLERPLEVTQSIKDFLR